MLRSVVRELQGDHRTGGVPHHVSPLHLEVIKQGSAVRRLIGDLDPALCLARPGLADPVVTDDAVVLRQRRLARKRSQTVHQASAVDQDDGLPGPVRLVLELDPVYPQALYARSMLPQATWLKHSPIAISWPGANPQMTVSDTWAWVLRNLLV